MGAETTRSHVFVRSPPVPPDPFWRGRWSCRSGRLNLAVAHLAFYPEMTVGLQANYPEKTVAASRADWR